MSLPFLGDSLTIGVVESSVSNRAWFSIKALAVRAVGAFCLNQHTNSIIDRSSIVKENVLAYSRRLKSTTFPLRRGLVVSRGPAYPSTISFTSSVRSRASDANR